MVGAEQVSDKVDSCEARMRTRAWARADRRCQGGSRAWVVTWRRLCRSCGNAWDPMVGATVGVVPQAGPGGHSAGDGQ